MRLLPFYVRWARDRYRWAKRWAEFKYWYLAALIQQDRIKGLGLAIKRKFNDPWIADVVVQKRPVFGPDVSTRRSVYWEAPVAVVIFRHDKTGSHAALCMSLYVIGDVIYIKQLQGIASTHIPAAIRDWPRLLVEACQDFAVAQNYRQVRIAQASSMPHFQMAGLSADTPAAGEKIRAGIQSRMLAHYDGTAKTLGFVEAGRWFIWPNPKYRPQ